MDNPRHVTNTSLLSPCPLPRTHESLNLTKLCEKHPTCEISISLPASEASGSRSSQVLYMKDDKTARRALSSMGNRSEHFLGGQFERKESLSLAEEITWNIVDQEIFEWQYSCYTGRPYWWSPESKYTQPKNVQLQSSSEIWMGGASNDCLKPNYSQQRRAVSEGFAQDPNASHDLAHLVAVQLLGSCFTLPPDDVGEGPAPNYTMWNGTGVALPDPRMISSLRMHSYFRYSPSFGHQARNASPISMWMAFDGACPPFLEPPQKAEASTGARGLHRCARRHTSEGTSYDGTIERASVTDTATSVDGPDILQTKEIAQDTIGRSHPTFNFIRHESLQAEVDSSDEEKDPNSKETLSSSKRGKLEHRFHSALLTEPHHVFVQPVKELVTRIWKTFRNRIGTSLHLRSEDGSESGQSTCSNASTNLDGRARRRRAQQDSEIDGSMDSVVHLNTPVTGQATPQLVGSDTSSLTVSRNPTFQFQLADPLVAAAELVAALSTAQIRSLQESSVEVPRDDPVHDCTAVLPSEFHGDTTSTAEEILQSAEAQTPATPKQTCAVHSYSIRRNQSRKRRKSMLSEVYTVEEYNQITPVNDEARSPHMTAGGMLPPAFEEIEPLSPFQQRKSWLDTSTSSDNETAETPKRPAMCRLNTSGTQIFRPDRDGIEVDGLPVGPTKNVWDEEKGGERTYL